ncbi:MAG TPA: DUF2207 domain-containing protein [Flavobacteriaceae bacterium]|nr:DUF2207 domain-containing protein [Flavobacteriaceae bacterium]
MKHFFLFLFLSIGLQLFAQEKILSYYTDITVKANGDLIVTEEIKVKSEGDKIKRGIYRSFPTKYKNTLGTSFNVGFEVLEVMRDNKPEPFHIDKKGNGVFVYIGEKNTLLKSGVYTYTLTFKTTRQIGFFENYDELYFNAVGGDWDFPIENVTVTVTLDSDVSIQEAKAFAGNYGTDQCDCTIDISGNAVQFTTTRSLNPEEQFTFVANWEKGFVIEPTQSEKTALFFRENFHVLFAFFALLIPFLLYFFAWKKVGVDPKKGTIIPLFEPPSGFSPAAVSYLHRMYFTTTTLTSALVNMAVKGYLIIENKKSGSYTLVKTSQQTQHLSADEQVLYNSLFAKRDKVVIDNKDHKLFGESRKALQKHLKQKLKPTYFKLNYAHLKKGILASVALMIVLAFLSPSPAIPVITFILMVVMALIFTYLIKAPTPKGRKLMDEIEGFKMYLSVAEQRQLESVHHPKLTVEKFEAYLPYAIALGVENSWAKKFEKEVLQALQDTSSKSYSPVWYVAAGSAVFSPSKFTSGMGSAFSSAIASASTPPGSSSGSSGGFSGGGGGGGGGGGW